MAFDAFDRMSTFTPDVVHLNDWQTGLAAALHRCVTSPRRRTVFSHSQSRLSRHLRSSDVRPPRSFRPICGPSTGLEFHGAMSFIKGGIAFADRIATVSPTYAREIQTPEYGHGLDGLIRHRAAVLRRHPQRHRHDRVESDRRSVVARALHRHESRTKADQQTRRTITVGARPCRRAPARGRQPARHQKGIDLILALVDALVSLPAQLAVLGTGDPTIEQALHAAQLAIPRSRRVTPRHDETMAHLIEAGADIFLMPSRFEPCGLNQMYSQAYGTVPVVRRTGGLVDTVRPVSGRIGNRLRVRTALHPKRCSTRSKRAVATARNRHTWQAIQRNGMAQDFSWTTQRTPISRALR